MHIDQVGIERPVQHLLALPGRDAEPAACRHRGAFFQTDRRVHQIAGAIAQREFGMRRHAGKQDHEAG